MVSRIKKADEGERRSMSMPMPAGSSVESLPDGGLRVQGALPLAEHAAWWRRVAKAVETGIADRPSRIVLVVAGQEAGVIVPPDTVLGPRMTTVLLLVLTALEPDTKVEAIGYDLACGCGLRVRVVRSGWAKEGS